MKKTKTFISHLFGITECFKKLLLFDYIKNYNRSHLFDQNILKISHFLPIVKYFPVKEKRLTYFFINKLNL